MRMKELPIINFQFSIINYCLLLYLGSTLFACASPEPPPPPQPWFVDQSAAQGIDFVHVRSDEIRFYLPEIMSGGAGWIDYDRDGFLDLYLVQGGALDAGASIKPGNKLYRNMGGTSFEEVTDQAKVGDTGYGMGLAIGDYDLDGDDDLYVTNVGPNVLYRNEGNGAFTDATNEAGIGHPGWGTSAVFADYNNDGYPDLYVVNYINWSPEQELACTSGGAGRDYCHPDNYRAPATDVLYLNQQDGSFLETTRQAGIAETAANGLGIVAADFNDDNLVDFYIANDGNPNNFWVNNGDGTFTDRGLMSGTAVNRQGMAEAGMGVTAFDLEQDGDLDLFMTHLRDETNTLYRNDGGGFQDVTVASGLSTASIAYTGFGVGAADFDHDGLKDVYVVNGRVGRSGVSRAADPFAEPNQLFKGSKPGAFQEVLPEGGLATPLVETSRAAAFGDYDNDGDIDIAVANNGGVARLLQNISTKKGNWIGFLMRNEQGAPATGAQLKVYAGSRLFYGTVQRAGSYQASNDPRIHLGIGQAAAIDSAIVTWPNGTRSLIERKEANAYHLISK